MAKNSIEIMFSIALLMGIAACTKPSQGGGQGTSPEEPLLHTVWDMNLEEAVINSHAGEELGSVLQPMYSMKQLIPHSKLLVGQPSSTIGTNNYFSCYPRIKKLKNGSFLLLYHYGQYGGRIWCCTSDDFKTWSTPYMLYEPYQVSFEDGSGKNVSDTRHFVNPDAVVLNSGEILMVCSYRAAAHYGSGLDCGLSFRRSTNNGRTWSQPRELPVGPNWEPYLLLLPDGRLHCYYTDAIPQTRNSGTALIVSEDGGHTWSEPIRVCQQYKYDYKTANAEYSKYNGQKIYTDQMPCFRVLNDGKTIAGWLEARLENPTPSDCADKSTYNSFCMMSLVRNPSLEWKDLTSYNVKVEGPSDRQTNVMRGSGGYISTFPSGETVLSFTVGNLFKLKLGDASAKKFRGSKWTDDLMQALDYKGFWGCTEVFGQNFMAVGMHSKDKGMQLGMMYLNHRIDAPSCSVEVDGDTREWTGTRALYLSAPDGAEAIIRAACDPSNIYLAVERLDENVDDTDIQNIILSAGGAQYTLKAGPSGASSSGISGLEAVSRRASCDKGGGYVCEIRIPRSSIAAQSASTLRIYADIVSRGTRYPFTFANPSDTNTWQTINFK